MKFDSTSELETLNQLTVNQKVYAFFAESDFAESMEHFAEFFSAKWALKVGGGSK